MRSLHPARDAEVQQLWDRGYDQHEVADYFGTTLAQAREWLTIRCKLPLEVVKARDNRPTELLLCQNIACGKQFPWHPRMSSRKPFYCSQGCLHEVGIRRHKKPAVHAQVKRQEAGKRFGKLLGITARHFKKEIDENANPGKS